MISRKVSGGKRQKRDAERQGSRKKRLRWAVKASFGQKRMGKKQGGSLRTRNPFYIIF
jgi:hypothetical protein